MTKLADTAFKVSGSLLVRKIDGDFYNVVGLPIAEISRLLRTFGSSKTEEELSHGKENQTL